MTFSDNENVCGGRHCCTLLEGVNMNLILYMTPFQYLSKFKVYISFDPEILHLGIHSKKCKSKYTKIYGLRYKNFYYSLAYQKI